MAMYRVFVIIPTETVFCYIIKQKEANSKLHIMILHQYEMDITDISQILKYIVLILQMNSIIMYIRNKHAIKVLEESLVN